MAAIPTELGPTTRVPAQAPVRGRWIPWAIVAFFAVVVIVNGVMIWFAVRTFPGLDSSRPYELGIAYNRTLEAVARQKALGWSGAITGSMAQGFAAEIRLEMRGRDGAPLVGATAAARLLRPGDKAQDRAVPLLETVPGTYSGSIVLPSAGNWDVEATVDLGGDHWATRERLILR